MSADAARRPTLGVALVLFSSVAFAISPVAARLAFDDASNTLTIVTLRSVVGAVLMALMLVVLRQRFALDRRAWHLSAWCGVFQALTVYGFIGSVGYVPIAVAVLVFFTYPVLVAVAVHWRGGERLTPAKAALMPVVLLGLALVLGPEYETLDPTGIALAALAAVAVSGMILASTRVLAHATSTQVNFHVTTANSVAFALLTSAAGAWALPQGGIGWLGIVGAGLGTGLGLLTFYAALRHLSPVRVTMISNVEPLLSVLFAAAILGERLSALRWLGVVVVIAALLAFEAIGQRRPAPAS
jgi:drug/metabolite transporter (DMT)-like permease